MKSKVLLLLVLVVAVSGCTEFGNLFGGDVINVEQKVVENGERDVIIVKDIQTIPISPLLPDQQVMLSFLLENRDKLKDATASVDLFNAPTMHSANPPYELCNLYTGTAGSLVTSDVGECQSTEVCVIQNIQTCPFGGSGLACDSGGGFAGKCCKTNLGTSTNRICKPDQCGVDGGCIILPGEEKPVTFIFKTPSESDIKGIKTSTKLDFKIIYKFSGSLNYIVPAVSSEEIAKRQRTGEKIDLQQTKSYSSGPLQIDAQILGAPYILSNGAGNLGNVQNPESIITFNIRNRGSGSVVGSQIDSEALEINFPPELEIVRKGEIGKEIENDKFTCAPSSVPNLEGWTTCVNDRRSANGETLGVIPIYREESRSAIRFTVKLRQSLNEPFRSYQITANVNYNYELRNSVDVTINPFQNV